MVSKKQIKKFQEEILAWYEKNKRDLPWRHSRDPYNILVSEVMLQQTQVDRVIPKFKEWMEKFPTIESLAKASTRDVLVLWSGLGYNRRALYLKKLAQEPVLWPETEEALQKLPGIGPYTARAILCFACNQQIAVVDTNVRKVILTQFKNAVIDESDIQKIADHLLPMGKAYEWNQALMDYASANLKKEKIPLPKQKPFKNSDRYYRGKIVLLLVGQEKITRQELRKQLEIEEKRLLKILEGLEKDGLIQRKGNDEIF